MLRTHHHIHRKVRVHDSMMAGAADIPLPQRQNYLGRLPPHALPAFRPLAVGTFGLQGQTATLAMTPSNSITYISYISYIIYHVSPSNHLRKQQQVMLPVSLVTSRNLLQYAAIKTNNSEQLQNKTRILSIFPGALKSVHTSSWQFWFQPESRIICPIPLL